MDKPNYYAIIPANVRYDKELTPNAKLLYAEITSLCNKEGHCWATNDYFASLYEVSRTSISKWVSQLISNGYLKSIITYKKGTKEIDKRYLSLVNGAIEEKLTDNNTSNNTKENNKEIYPTFSDFWNLYNKKVSRTICEKKWDKLKHEEKVKIMEHIPIYFKAQPDPKFRKLPETFLNKRSWEDEIESQTLFNSNHSIPPPKNKPHWTEVQAMFDI